MNAKTSTVTDLGSPIQSTPSSVLIAGTITERREHNDKFYTRVIIPSTDPLLNPNRVEIRSSKSIGVEGETIEAECTVGGYNSNVKGTVYNNIHITLTKDLIDFAR